MIKVQTKQKMANHSFSSSVLKVPTFCLTASFCADPGSTSGRHSKTDEAVHFLPGGGGADILSQKQVKENK